MSETYEQLRDAVSGEAGQAWRQADREEGNLRARYRSLKEDPRFTEEHKAEKAWESYETAKEKIAAGRQKARESLRKQARTGERLSIPLPDGEALITADTSKLLASQNEAALDKELAGAIRTRDALQRAVEACMADVASYRLEHASRLQQNISAALDAKAQTLAEHVRAAAALFAEYEDGQLVAKRIGGPRQGAPENTGDPQDSAVLIGPMSTRTVAGPNRGDIEAVLSYLASLGQPATIVGGGGGEG